MSDIEDWKEDDEFVAWLAKRNEVAPELILRVSTRGWLDGIWDAWRDGRVIGESTHKAKVAELEGEKGKLDVLIDDARSEIRRMAGASGCHDLDRIEQLRDRVAELKAKIHVLETAVRDVRDGRRRGESGYWLARLLELVSDESKEGGA